MDCLQILKVLHQVSPTGEFYEQYVIGNVIQDFVIGSTRQSDNCLNKITIDEPAYEVLLEALKSYKNFCQQQLPEELENIQSIIDAVTA